MILLFWKSYYLSQHLPASHTIKEGFFLAPSLTKSSRVLELETDSVAASDISEMLDSTLEEVLGLSCPLEGPERDPRGWRLLLSQNHLSGRDL